MFDLKALENGLKRAQIDIDRILDALQAPGYMPDSAREHLLSELGSAIREYRVASYDVSHARQHNERYA